MLESLITATHTQTTPRTNMKNRDEVLDEFVERIVDGMDLGTLMTYAIDKMRESYDEVSDEDLTKEIADFYPDLLEE